jgi:lipopolysaccharide/colanic/teichoic acid biosynthesis glycosyltransferase
MSRFTLSDVRIEPALRVGRARRPRRRSALQTQASHAGGPGVRFDSRAETAARRALDLAISSAALTVLAPVFVAIAIAIKTTSPGPVFYRQTRVGRNLRRGDRRATSAHGPRDRRRGDRRETASFGVPFQIVKFRTMVMHAEEYGPQWSTRNDPRITTVGRFLRKTRLDETPQFWNVLRGEMSLIGPRPERPYFVEQFVECIPGYEQRLRVRPGITGLAQVTLDYDSNIDDVKLKLEHDLVHVRERSLVKDLAILARTGYVVVTGKGAL